MRQTALILPFVKRAAANAAAGSSDQDKSAICPHCGGTMGPGDVASDCSSAPRMQYPAAPFACEPVTQAGRSIR